MQESIWRRRFASARVGVLVAWASLGMVACGGAAPAPHAPGPLPAAPADGATASAEGPAKMGDPFQLAAPLADDPPPAANPPPPNMATFHAAAATPGVPPPPATCKPFTHRAAAHAAAACAAAPGARGALAAAHDHPAAARRDAALASLESCHGLPRGLVRALRADLAPPECGDALADPWFNLAAKDPAPPAVVHALVGQSLGARLARTVAKPPAMHGVADKKHVLAYVAGPLRQWIEGQARAIESLSQAGSSLAAYGRGIAAVEAGLADMRFVDSVRQVPLPKEFEGDQELKTAYYAALDQALDPRKDRGRDAALVGLRELSALGIVNDPRVARARTLLGRLYAGRRIDALDALLLPPLPEVSKLTVEERLAAKLPTFYASLVLDEATMKEPAIVRALLRQGVPPGLRAAASSSLPADARLAYARGRAEEGRTYFRAVDFDVAARVADPLRGGTDVTPAQRDEATFLVALGVAFHDGPRDAVALMHAASPAALNLRQVAALDAVRGTYQGLAAYDAALLLSVAPPDDASRAYFTEVANRFHAAAALLSGADKGLAEERAHAAEQIAAAAPAPTPGAH